MKRTLLLLLLAAAACDTPDGSTPGLDGSWAYDAGVDAGAADAGLLPWLSPCTEDAQCATGLCFHFNAYGPRCTHACTADGDCEANSGGCSNRGVCKPH